MKYVDEYRDRGRARALIQAIRALVAEIELDSVDEAYARPAWLGAEATHAQRYYNLALASRPYSQWEQAERLALDLKESPVGHKP